MPNLLEYLSYNCNFMGILAGPTCSYNDYMAFIEGTAYQPRHLETNGKENGKYKHTEPSPKVPHCLSLIVRLVRSNLEYNYWLIPHETRTKKDHDLGYLLLL